MTLAVACTFQDFEYLQDGGDDAEGGTSGSGTSGSSGESGTSGRTGGTSGASGSSTGGRGGSEPTGGTAGEDETGGGAGETTGGAAGTDTGGMGGMMAGMGGMGGRGGSGGSGGTGAVGELVNPSFENFSTTGWTVDPPAALTSRYIYVQAPTGAVPAPDGAYELSTWHQTEGYVLEIFQTVEGLEDGMYTFSAMISHGPHNEIHMFARDCGGTDVTLLVPETSATAFEAFALADIEVVGGECTVGLHVDANFNQWMNADLFALEPQ